MSYDDRVNARPSLNDESDVEEEALVNDYREQVNFEDGMSDLDRTTSLGGSQAQDLQAQLTAAATPLEYQATLETKFASYDNYCSLFHYILNSEGPVDLEVPSVCALLHRSVAGGCKESHCLAFIGPDINLLSST
jgi:translation initiation factor 3 subunit L